MSIFEMREAGSRRYRRKREIDNNPSFSSTLLDKIYRSMDEGGVKRDDLRLYRDAMSGKQSMREEDGVVQKRRQNGAVRKEMDERKEAFTEFQRRLRYEQELDQDYICFSSTSSSSDSSSGVFSSSDTESTHGSNSIVSSCFISSKPKPIKTNVSERIKKTETKRRPLFSEQSLNESKERAMKIYGNLKKVRPPVSPGARLTNFLNTLFTAGNNRKKTSSKSSAPIDGGRRIKTEQVSSCASASSYSRSCLSKLSPSTRERMRNGNEVKRTVRFCPVSVIVGEDSRPCGHKQLYEQQRLPTGRAADRPTQRVEERAREFLREYHKNNRKSLEEDDEDAWSDSSSDLFELDHLSVTTNDRYIDDLPMYETTTRLDRNRAIF